MEKNIDEVAQLLKGFAATKEEKFYPEDEVLYMIKIVTVQRDNTIAQLNDVLMENYRLLKTIDSLAKQLEKSEATPDHLEKMMNGKGAVT